MNIKPILPVSTPTWIYIIAAISIIIHTIIVKTTIFTHSHSFFLYDSKLRKDNPRRDAPKSRGIPRSK